MTYYKIIQDDTITDAGFCFLKENKKGTLLYCEIDDAQLMQSYDGNKLYHCEWLKNVPTFTDYETCEAVVIDEAEYNDIVAYLDDGEEVPVTPDEPEPVEPDEPEDEEDTEEKPMTLAEMREKITEQEETIAMLTDCILEMSEIIYGE